MYNWGNVSLGLKKHIFLKKKNCLHILRGHNTRFPFCLDTPSNKLSMPIPEGVEMVQVGIIHF